MASSCFPFIADSIHGRPHQTVGSMECLGLGVGEGEVTNNVVGDNSEGICIGEDVDIFIKRWASWLVLVKGMR